jgi:galactonate dehydratase
VSIRQLDRRDFLVSAATAAAGGLGLLSGPGSRFALAREEARKAKLKVTDLKTIVVNAGGKNYVFVKVVTNRGLVGLGEGSITSKARTVEQAILEHRRYLVGQDPTDIEMHWQAMYRWPRWRGGPILNSAISAVEIALWDILGQSVGLPVWKLLGGRARHKMQMYVHAGGTTPEDYAKNWAQAKADGWVAAKGGFLRPRGLVVDPSRDVRDAIARLKAVREAVGPDFRILIDLHGFPTPPMAVEFCARAEQYSPYFVEEATQIEDVDELAHLRNKTRVPLATGERLFTKYGFAPICSRHLVDYVQPDVVHCGGILELKKIATIAEAYRIQTAPHNPQSSVSTLASLHVDVTTPNFAIQEISRPPSQFFQDLFRGDGPRFKDGYALIPGKPGLGVTLDEKVAAKRPYVPANRPRMRFGDGAVTDH